ncbi:phage tail protein, partial [Lysinibacillus fusiformis]|uniref:phage tail protein n=1 Tax=Lysinibacillus fusiformis TaxID=28031 RepID=UPI003B975C16
VVHQGQNQATGTDYVIGQIGGVETVTLNTSQLPVHTHQVNAFSLEGTTLSPEKAVWAKNIQYSTQPTDSPMNAT